MRRDIAYPRFVLQGDTIVQEFANRTDNFPLVTTSFSGDNTQFKRFGPISGRRYEIDASYLADIKQGGVLSADFNGDFRQYFQTSSRTLLAARVFTAVSNGNTPNFYYFGGLNTLRGYDFRALIGDRAFFGNFEFRFPLIDVIATPVLAITQIRGNLFFDVGGAYFRNQPFTFISNNKLQDAKASVGWGLSFNLFGLELHWDFARRTDLQNVDARTRTTFWIGETF
jgi:outer membrane protein assembly factor BamA